MPPRLIAMTAIWPRGRASAWRWAMNRRLMKVKAQKTWYEPFSSIEVLAVNTQIMPNK